jgi:hypothetical protein
VQDLRRRVRIADEFGCESIGIQYQQGLKDLLPASDLVEGILNNSDRPPVANAKGEIIRDGQPLTHFNEVDECAGLDGLFTNRVHTALGQPVENTLHDLRWGDFDQSGTTKEYVWVFLISGSAPPAHHIDGYKGTDSMRQPYMYFRLGGGTVRGIAKPGEIVWSRVFLENGKLKMDLGRAKVITLPSAEETERRWKETTEQWPIMHAVTYGVTRDQMMARHKANHIQVAYANSAPRRPTSPCMPRPPSPPNSASRSRSAAPRPTARSFKRQGALPQRAVFPHSGAFAGSAFLFPPSTGGHERERVGARPISPRPPGTHSLTPVAT